MSYECRSYVSVGLLSVGLMSVGLMSVGLMKQHHLIEIFSESKINFSFLCKFKINLGRSLIVTFLPCFRNVNYIRFFFS